jgi:hypothetical protein
MKYQYTDCKRSVHSVSKSDLDNAMAVLQRATNFTQDFSYDKAYGGYRLVRDNGAREVSPRLNKREMYHWICAYIYGIQDGQKILSTQWNKPTPTSEFNPYSYL